MIGNIIAETPWEISRLGKFTSSRISELFSEPRAKKDQGKLSESALGYIFEKASEIVTGTTRQIQNWAMEWGVQYEPECAFRIREDNPGFIYLGKENPEFFKYTDFSGGSPDGYDPKERVIDEIKCPENPKNHIAYCMITGNEAMIAADKGYYLQMQMNMACVAKHLGVPFESMKARFTSYCPLVNSPYKDIHHVMIDPDIEFYDKLPKVIDRAERKLAETVEAMIRKKKENFFNANHT